MRESLPRTSGRGSSYTIRMSSNAEMVVSTGQPNPGQPKRRPRYQPMVLTVVPFATGILLDRWLDVPWFVWLVACVAFLIGWSLARSPLRVTGDRASVSVLWSSILLTLAFASFGGLWHHVRWNWYPADHIACFVDDDPQLCCVRGKLISEPRICLLYTSPSPRDATLSRMPSSA